MTGPPRSRLQERLAALAALIAAAGLFGLADAFVTRPDIGPRLASEPGFFIVAGAGAALVVYAAGRAIGALLGGGRGEDAS